MSIKLSIELYKKGRTYYAHITDEDGIDEINVKGKTRDDFMANLCEEIVPCIADCLNDL